MMRSSYAEFQGCKYLPHFNIPNSSHEFVEVAHVQIRLKAQKNSQNQQLTDALRSSCSEQNCNIHRKSLTINPFFSKVSGLGMGLFFKNGHPASVFL